MSDREHKLIGSLKQQLADKVMDRRDFVRYATLLGMAAPTAYMWAGKIAGEDFVPAARYVYMMRILGPAQLAQLTVLLHRRTVPAGTPLMVAETPALLITAPVTKVTGRLSPLWLRSSLPRCCNCLVRIEIPSRN